MRGKRVASKKRVCPFIRLHFLLCSGQAIFAFADDYAFVIQGLLDLYEVSFDCALIRLALQLQEKMDAFFWDAEKNSGFYLSEAGDSSILMRMMEGQSRGWLLWAAMRAAIAGISERRRIGIRESGVDRVTVSSIVLCLLTEQDGAEPATNSIAASNLLRLADILQREEMRERARKIFEGAASRLSKYPYILPKMLVAHHRASIAPTQVKEEL
jgi:uncharacterized protein YyaL (SSP411 family)